MKASEFKLTRDFARRLNIQLIQVKEYDVAVVVAVNVNVDVDVTGCECGCRCR